jgi:hypothetical protein
MRKRISSGNTISTNVSKQPLRNFVGIRAQENEASARGDNDCGQMYLFNRVR